MRKENRFAHELLSYMTYLDGNYISFNLLKKIYAIIKHPLQSFPDSSFDADLEFEVNDQIDYLATISIVKRVSNERVTFHEVFQNQLKRTLATGVISEIIETTLKILNPFYCVK